MLKDVQSVFFIRILFSHINEKVKLKLVKYNKSLQNIIHVDLINYKLYKGNYVIYDSNGIGKEYNSFNDKLVFKGEYSNGERKGKGEEYGYGCKVIFEGEYLNGKRNGKGKEYDYKGNLIFEGEYLNGKRWINKYNKYTSGKFGTYKIDSDIKIEYFKGKDEETNDKLLIGVEYFTNPEISDHGEIQENNDSFGYIEYNLPNLKYKLKNGKLNIMEYDEHGNLEFEGELFNGKRNGKGKEYCYNKLIFEGEYFNGKRWNGIGYNGNNLIYELKNGNGWVKEFSGEKLIFEGEYINGEKCGKGKEYYNNKLIYEGEYLNGKRNGKG